MRRLVPLLFALAASCAFQGRVNAPVETPSLEKTTQAATYIHLLFVRNYGVDKDDPNSRKWEVRTRFYEDTEYEAIIQIVRIGPHTLVEAFRTPNGKMLPGTYDRHSSSAYESRVMFIYPGTVVGADWRGNFAMLEMDETGCKTDIGQGFNTEHRRTHAVTGRVLSGDRSRGFIWTIDARPDGISINYPYRNDLCANSAEKK